VGGGFVIVNVVVLADDGDGVGTVDGQEGIAFGNVRLPLSTSTQ
jgi:hypothetical protein